MLWLYHSRPRLRVSRSVTFRDAPPGDTARAMPGLERNDLGTDHVHDDGVETADDDKRLVERPVDAGAGRDVRSPARGAIGDGLLEPGGGGAEVVDEFSRESVGDEEWGPSLRVAGERAGGGEQRLIT